MRCERLSAPIRSTTNRQRRSVATARAADPDPDRARLLPRLRQAVAAALATATPADRLLLSLYYVQDMTLAQIARVQGVHEATISRQLDRIRRELRSSVEQSLVAGRPPKTATPPSRAFRPPKSSCASPMRLRIGRLIWAARFPAPPGREKM